jgi:hypothetical protein
MVAVTAAAVPASYRSSCCQHRVYTHRHVSEEGARSRALLNCVMLESQLLLIMLPIVWVEAPASRDFQ